MKKKLLLTTALLLNLTGCGKTIQSQVRSNNLLKLEQMRYNFNQGRLPNIDQIPRTIKGVCIADRQGYPTYETILFSFKHEGDFYFALTSPEFLSYIQQELLKMGPAYIDEDNYYVAEKSNHPEVILTYNTRTLNDFNGELIINENNGEAYCLFTP